MSGLLASEFRRFRSRRLVKVLVALEVLAVVATGPVYEVLTAGHATGLLVRLDDVAEGLRILGEAGIDARVDDGLIRVGLPPADAARVTRTLADRGLYLTELRADEADLETVFLELTGGASTEGSR